MILLIIGILCGIIIMYILTEIKNRCFFTTDSRQQLLNIIRVLTRQCSRWLVAAEQDISDFIAILHVQYGMGYLWAIKDIASTDDFKLANGFDMLEFERKATTIQDRISKRVLMRCPEFQSNISDPLLYRIAGE